VETSGKPKPIVPWARPAITMIAITAAIVAGEKS